MNRFNLVKRNLCGILAAGSLFVAGASSASATHYPPSHCHYKTVITFEYETRPVIDWVTKHDHCGNAFEVKVVRYVTVKVPVKKYVKVCY